jgi:hypothetical protein
MHPQIGFIPDSELESFYDPSLIQEVLKSKISGDASNTAWVGSLIYNGP